MTYIGFIRIMSGMVSSGMGANAGTALRRFRLATVLFRPPFVIPKADAGPFTTSLWLFRKHTPGPSLHILTIGFHPTHLGERRRSRQDEI